jgi:hypothetical protein
MLLESPNAKISWKKGYLRQDSPSSSLKNRERQRFLLSGFRLTFIPLTTLERQSAGQGDVTPDRNDFTENEQKRRISASSSFQLIPRKPLLFPRVTVAVIA